MKLDDRGPPDSILIKIRLVFVDKIFVNYYLRNKQLLTFELIPQQKNIIPPTLALMGGRKIVLWQLITLTASYVSLNVACVYFNHLTNQTLSHLRPPPNSLANLTAATDRAVTDDRDKKLLIGVGIGNV